MTPHLDDGRIAELLDGEIPSSELAAIQAHLAACPDCAARLASAQADMDEADGLISALDEPEAITTVIPINTARRASRRDWLRRAAWAASLVVAVGAGYLARGPFTPRQADEPVATSPAIEAAQPRSVTSPAERGAVPEAPPVASRPEIAPQAAAPQRATADAAVSVEPEARREAARQAPTPSLSTNALEDASVTTGATSAEFAARSRDQVTSKQLLPVDTIDMTEAVERLGGSIRLVDGRFPVRIEAVGEWVRVIYGGPSGEFRLEQTRVDDRIAWRLMVPAGFPAESLAAIRRRVND